MWMSEADFRAQFPHFGLEDKAGLKGGGNVSSTARGPTLKTYSQRAGGGQGNN